jgi:hypothetical protein
MLTNAFPSLAKNDAQTSNNRKDLERLKLPESFQTRAIHNYGTFVPIGVQILERLEKCTAGCNIILGVDAEWDALTTENKRDPHPATLQLALVDGSIVVVLHTIHMFSRIKESEISSCTVLAQIMCHPKIFLLGVNVATDIGHLAKHYSHHFIGEKDTLLKIAYDVKKVLQGFGLVGGDSGLGSLDALLPRYENKTLDKVRNMPPHPHPRL